MARTPDQIAADWAQRLSQSTQKIADGVDAVQIAPGQLAARQKQVWAQNVVASQDKWAKRTASVPLADWQKAMKDKAVPRIASGATAAQDKFTGFMSQLLPHIDQVKRQLPQRGNLDQNIARMTSFVRGMATFSYNR